MLCLLFIVNRLTFSLLNRVCPEYDAMTGAAILHLLPTLSPNKSSYWFTSKQFK